MNMYSMYMIHRKPYTFIYKLLQKSGPSNIYSSLLEWLFSLNERTEWSNDVLNPSQDSSTLLRQSVLECWKESGVPYETTDIRQANC